MRWRPAESPLVDRYALRGIRMGLDAPDLEHYRADRAIHREGPLEIPATRNGDASGLGGSRSPVSVPSAHRPSVKWTATAVA